MKRWFGWVGLLAAAAVGPVFITRFQPDFSTGAACAVSLAACLLWGLFAATLYGASTRKGLRESLESLGPAFLPLLLLLPGWNYLPLSAFPQHDFPLRKAEIAFGLAYVPHLAWLTALLVRDALRAGRRLPAAVFGIAALLLFTGTALHTVSCDLTGDEPHYLLVTHSLLRDGDIELSNNYANHDEKAFYDRGFLQPQGNEHRLSLGRIYSHHPLGPSLLFYPGYALAGRLGASLTVAFLAAMTLFLTLLSLPAMGFPRATVVRCGWVGLFASPLWLYSGLLYAEVPSACLIAFLLWAATRWRWTLVALGLGCLPWMHNRNLLVLAPALLYIFYQWNERRTPWRSVREQVAVFLLPLAAMVAFFVGVYEVWTPLGAHHEAFGSLFSFDRAAIGWSGLLVDQEAGLWAYFPVFVFVPAGILLGWSKRGEAFQAAAFSLIGYYLAMSFYQNLGLTPPARYFAPLVPCLLVALAPALQALDKVPAFWRRLALALGVVSFALNLALAAVPWLRYNKLEGQSWVLEFARKATGLPWSSWVPSFHATPLADRSFIQGGGLLVAAAVLCWLFVRSTRRKRIK